MKCPATEVRIVILGFLAAPRFDDNGNVTGGGENGGVPGGNIPNADLYNEQRVDPVEFRMLKSTVLADLGVSNPNAFDGTRDPFLGVFKFNGEEVTLTNNPFLSRSRAIRDMTVPVRSENDLAATDPTRRSDLGDDLLRDPWNSPTCLLGVMGCA